MILMTYYSYKILILAHIQNKMFPVKNIINEITVIILDLTNGDLKMLKSIRAAGKTRTARSAPPVVPLGQPQRRRPFPGQTLQRNKSRLKGLQQSPIPSDSVPLQGKVGQLRPRKRPPVQASPDEPLITHCTVMAASEMVSGECNSK